MQATKKKFYLGPQSEVEKSAGKFFNICKTGKRYILTMKSTADSAHVTTEQMHRRHTDEMSRQVTEWWQMSHEDVDVTPSDGMTITKHTAQ